MTAAAILPAWACLLIFGEDDDFSSLFGNDIGDLRGVAGVGVTERERVEGRVREAAPLLQVPTNRKLMRVG